MNLGSGGLVVRSRLWRRRVPLKTRRLLSLFHAKSYVEAKRPPFSEVWRRRDQPAAKPINKGTDDEKEENVVLMEESEDYDFGSFQQETEATETEEETYLESNMADSSTNIYILIDNVRDVRIGPCPYICKMDGFNGGELDVTNLRSTSLAKSKLVLEVNDQFVESQLKFILPYPTFGVDCREEVFVFQVV
ncbi:hypothetical protein AVEN_91702-1 [Araneus ventricosus]|uniref:Uncharacterized protein n=1 Tax=Araneus ventricosus TaxID=182803 RepID=A0A4Y2HH47_ARAVE|nr:hypothetical protein AVEN_91702-1 [Araneus ventricosus]